jgi:hypothetical protein
VVAVALFVGVLVVVVTSVGVVLDVLSPELLPATTGAPAGAAGVSVAELLVLLVLESSTTCYPCLLRPRRLLQQNVSARKVYLSLLMPSYFPWTALCMCA